MWYLSALKSLDRFSLPNPLHQQRFPQIQSVLIGWFHQLIKQLTHCIRKFWSLKIFGTGTYVSKQKQQINSPWDTISKTRGSSCASSSLSNEESLSSFGAVSDRMSISELNFCRSRILANKCSWRGENPVPRWSFLIPELELWESFVTKGSWTIGVFASFRGDFFLIRVKELWKSFEGRVFLFLTIQFSIQSSIHWKIF